MRLLEPNTDIEQEKDLTLFIQKYLNEYQPGTIDKNGLRESSGMRRSFSDIRELYLNYNPDAQVSLDDLIKCLVNVKFSLPTTNICFRYCGTPEKVVIFANDKQMPFQSWKFVCERIWYWHDDYYYNKVGEDGLTDKYVIELLQQEFNNKNK